MGMAQHSLSFSAVINYCIEYLQSQCLHPISGARRWINEVWIPGEREPYFAMQAGDVDHVFIGIFSVEFGDGYGKSYPHEPKSIGFI